MKFDITPSEYIDYFIKTAKILDDNRDYVTELDSLLGDGDHMVNLYSGYVKVLEQSDILRQLPLSEMMKKIGMLILTGVGGSSGLLYGSAYIACAHSLSGSTSLNQNNFEDYMVTMLNEIKKRGQVNPGDKTMLDSLNQAIVSYQLEENGTLLDKLQAFKKGAHQGFIDTKMMIAQKGRGRYHATRGIGILDAGAMTMDLQLENLADTIIRKIESEQQK